MEVSIFLRTSVLTYLWWHSIYSGPSHPWEVVPLTALWRETTRQEFRAFQLRQPGRSYGQAQRSTERPDRALSTWIGHRTIFLFWRVALTHDDFASALVWPIGSRPSTLTET